MLRYDPERVKLDDVISPPYDVVDAEQVHALRARSPYNIAHVECSTDLDEESYRNAANTLSRWQEERVLKRDHSAAYYVY